MSPGSTQEVMDVGTALPSTSLGTVSVPNCRTVWLSALGFGQGRIFSARGGSAFGGRFALMRAEF
ncbi:MAG: hypothetical protein KAW02_05730 [candidate division Zixibacteria bacterium]|nr:hypothetical protein [candidate division Zixibacteria bacterium]